MLFNSIDFAIFLPIVFILYWSVNFFKKLSSQNCLLLIASYLFYGWWEWKFLSLIIISTITDYLIGLKIHKEDNNFKRKTLLLTSIGINLGILIFFKYCNFFIENFNTAFSFFGQKFNLYSSHVVLYWTVERSDQFFIRFFYHYDFLPISFTWMASGWIFSANWGRSANRRSYARSQRGQWRVTRWKEW